MHDWGRHHFMGEQDSRGRRRGSGLSNDGYDFCAASGTADRLGAQRGGAYVDN